MPVMFTKGDLFQDHELGAFAHGVSCAGNMDAGIALAFKKRWPEMFEDYRARCADRRVNLGDVLVWSDGKSTVYSLAIQRHWREKASLAALKRGVGRMVELAENGGIDRIGMPRVGTGMGGLDWNRARSVLIDAGSATKVGIIVFEQFIRSKGAPEADAAPPSGATGNPKPTRGDAIGATDGDAQESEPSSSRASAPASEGKPSSKKAGAKKAAGATRARPARPKVSAAARARKPSRH